MNLKRITLFLLVVNSCAMAAQLTRKVLFLGNSYTYVNDLPQLVKDIAASKGDALVFDQSVTGGYSFQNHWANTATYTKLQSNAWDIVVVQGQSQEPSFSPVQVMSGSYPYAKNLADSIRKINPCTEVMFYMTWGRKNGDADNCPAYPPVCSFDGMQSRLRQSYLMFADSFNASCAPVGVAWKKFRNAYPAVELYQPDESHPSVEGSYLAACVFYSAIFKKNVSGATYYSTVNATVAQNMQTLAGSTVMDSTSVWNLNSQIPMADFTYFLVNGSTYQFTNLSVNATTYNWSFGSAQTSPQNTFAGSPPYSVTLMAANNCTNSSVVKTIVPTFISENTACKSKVVYSADKLVLTNCEGIEEAQLIIYTIDGKLVKYYPAQTLTDAIDVGFLQQGLYMACLLENEKKYTFKFVKD